MYRKGRRHLQSYERSYKILLERMMRCDLALKGNIDGVELMIFPSNQLPEKSQRWNMLFFLWGVFRGKRESCLHQVPVSPKKLCIPLDIPDDIMSLPENICSLGSTDKNLTMPDRVHVMVTKDPTLIELPSLSSVETMNREQQDCIPYSNSSTSTRIILDQLRPEMFGHINSDTKVDGELQASVQATSAVCGSKTTMSEKTTCDLSIPLDRQQDSAYNINKVPTGAEDMASFTSTSEENVAVQNRMDSGQDVVKCGRNRGPEEGSLDAEATSERGMVMGVQITRETNSWQLDPKKRPYVGPMEKMSEVAYVGSSQTILWNEVNNPLGGERASKKQKTGPFERNNDNASFLGDDFASRMHVGALSPPIQEEKQCNTPSEERAIPMNSEYNGERFFFPVEPPRQVKDDKFIPWIGGSLLSENEDDKLRERAPNLELALGAELKTSRPIPPSSLVGKIDINLDEEPPEEEEEEEEEEEDVSASLSLSLSFPMPDKEAAVPAGARAEQAMPGKRHVNPSVLLFGGLSDK